MYRSVHHECSCGYCFDVREMVEMRIAPGRHWFSARTKEVVISQKILNRELKKTCILVCGRKINLFTCPKCGSLLFAEEII